MKKITEAQLKKTLFIAQTLGSAIKSFQDPYAAISYVINVLADRVDRDKDYISILFSIPTSINTLEHSSPKFHKLIHLLLNSPVAKSSGIIHDIDEYVNSANNKFLNMPNPELTPEEEITIAVVRFIKAMDKLMNSEETKRRE